MANDLQRVSENIQTFDGLDNLKKAKHLKFISDFSRSILKEFYEKFETEETMAIDTNAWMECLKTYSTAELTGAWANEREEQVSEHGRLKYRVVPEMLSTRINKKRRLEALKIKKLEETPAEQIRERVTGKRAQEIIAEIHAKREKEAGL